MSLVNVWIRTQSDGLVRADQIVGIDAHQTPALSGMQYPSGGRNPSRPRTHAVGKGQAHQARQGDAIRADAIRRVEG